MKNKAFGLAVIAVIALALTFTACDILNPDDDGDSTTFTSSRDFWDWYNNQPDNTPDEPYRVKLNSSSLGSLGIFSNRATDKKYVFLDFSGSTFTKISSGNTGDFEDCNILVGIIIPDTVTSIGDETGLGKGAFQDCSNLTSVTLPANAAFTRINQNTFARCAKLTGITIPDSVTSIGNNAFARTGLTSITIPDSVTSIGNNAFAGTGLTSIIIPNSVTSLSGFNDCTGITDITIPNSVTTIGSYAFSGCRLTSVTIPNSVTSIKIGAFAGTNLTSVTFEGNILSSEFQDHNIFEGSESFPGNLRGRYYAPEPGNKFVETGTPGTYTRPDTSSNTWTLQP